MESSFISQHQHRNGFTSFTRVRAGLGPVQQSPDLNPVGRLWAELEGWTGDACPVWPLTPPERLRAGIKQRLVSGRFLSAISFVEVYFFICSFGLFLSCCSGFCHIKGGKSCGIINLGVTFLHHINQTFEQLWRLLHPQQLKLITSVPAGGGCGFDSSKAPKHEHQLFRSFYWVFHESVRKQREVAAKFSV